MKGGESCCNGLGLSPPALPTCSPAHLCACLSSSIVSLLLFPTSLLFSEEPAGLVWCLETLCNLMLQQEHKFGSMTGVGSDPSSEALGETVSIPVVTGIRECDCCSDVMEDTMLIH